MGLFPVLLLVGSTLGSLIFCLIFWRSSPSWPMTARQWRTELLFQYYGLLAFLQDKFYKSKNVIDLTEEINRVVIVTGGNRGIGVHVVEKLLRCQMVVVVAVRDPARAKNEISSVLQLSDFNNKLQIEELDTSDFSSIRKFALRIKAQHPKIDLLIHNAGIMATPFKLTSDGLESQIAVNYFGPVLLTHLLYPLISRAGTESTKARIIFVSSVLHFAGEVPFEDFNCRTDYYPVQAYMNSKLCQVVIGQELQRLFNRRGQKNIQVFSVHPGLVNTDLIQYLANKRMWWRKNMCKTPEEGARSIVFASICKDLDFCGGDYISNCQRVSAKTTDFDLGKRLLTYTCNVLKIEDFGEK